MSFCDCEVYSFWNNLFTQMTGVSTVHAWMVESVRWWTMWVDTPVIVYQDGREENVQLVSHIEWKFNKKNINFMKKKNCMKSI